MPNLIHNIHAFVSLATQYLKDAAQCEPGKSQPIRAQYAKQLLDKIGITYDGPSPDQIHAIGPCIYVANHASTLDAVMICAFFDGDLRILAKDSLFKIPYLGKILRLEKHIMVHRGNHANQKNASLRNEIKNALLDGASVLFFPEGTRTNTGALGAFKNGAFYNAIQTGFPIVPIVIRGTFNAMPKSTLKITPSHCSLQILPPIPMPSHDTGDESAQVRDLAQRTRLAMQQALDQP